MAPDQQEHMTAQQLADILPVGVCIVNHEDTRAFVNKRFEDFTGPQEPTGWACLSRTIHPNDRGRVEDVYQTALSTRTALRTEYRTIDEKEEWRALALEPLSEGHLRQFGLSDNGGMISMVTDISTEKVAEMKQKMIAEDARERKQQQERFIDMISHEVRNPLSAILHCAEDIMEAVQDQRKKGKEQLAEIAEAAETINLCVAHQKKIIDDVLIFSKLDASMLTLRPQPVQPKTHLSTLLTMFRPELRKSRIEFEYKLDESYVETGLDWVMGDLDRMGQVLINIVSNAIKFTAEAQKERKIRVSMGACRRRPPSYPPNVVFFEPSEEALRLDTTNQPEWGDGEKAFIMVAVRDTGIGISDQHQKRLFERFKQATPKTDRIYGGFGLGLNISRRLCHMHGGEIGVSSKEGVGSTFGFFFNVRRCVEAEAWTQIGPQSPIDELCVQIGELDFKTPDVGRDTSGADFAQEPPVEHVNEVAVASQSDERKKHTEKLIEEVGNEPSEATAEPKVTHSNVDAHAPAQCPPEIMAKSKIAGRKRVLFVEDNIINQRIVSRRLKMAGFDVSEASNGREALETWKREAFDCILMDQEMPVMDGNTATKEIRNLEREKGGHILILGVTANVRQDQQAEMLEAGMDDIVHKPYKMKDLCDKIHEMTGEPDKKSPSGE
jgi:signal transduction histidine kinase/ActR/RegA family two-component response regulator